MFFYFHNQVFGRKECSTFTNVALLRFNSKTYLSLIIILISEVSDLWLNYVKRRF